MTHRYQCGQRVRLRPGFPHRNVANSPYRVVRQLPRSSDGEHQYRIKNEGEHYERVVRESQLEPQSEREHFMKCHDCGRWINMRNVDDVIAHEQTCDGALAPLRVST
jgi:hypothetical protein